MEKETKEKILRALAMPLGLGAFALGLYLTQGYFRYNGLEAPLIMVVLGGVSLTVFIGGGYTYFAVCQLSEKQNH